MIRRSKPRKPLGTIWEVPEPLWQPIEPILKQFWPKKRTGRRPANWRQVLKGIIFRMRTGCQWDQLPRRFGPKSTVHHWFQRWVEGGVCEKIWAVLVTECDELKGVQWKWQAADGVLAKARFGGLCRPQPDRSGQRRHQAEPDRRRSGRFARGRGGRGERQRPHAAGGDDRGGRGGAARPRAGRAAPVPGSGHDNEPSHEVVEQRRYVGHIRPIGEDRRVARQPGRRKPRRWVVERTMGWLNKCRALLVRYDKKARNYLGLIQLACGLLWFRRFHRMGAT